jgi:hypothetical protein
MGWNVVVLHLGQSPNPKFESAPWIMDFEESRNRNSRPQFAIALAVFRKIRASILPRFLLLAELFSKIFGGWSEFDHLHW